MKPDYPEDYKPTHHEWIILAIFIALVLVNFICSARQTIQRWPEYNVPADLDEDSTQTETI